MAEGSFPDLAAREAEEGEAGALPLGQNPSGSASEEALIVRERPASGHDLRQEVIEPGRALALADFSAPSVNPGCRASADASRPASRVVKPRRATT